MPQPSSSSPDARIARAAQQLADGPVLSAISKKAKTLVSEFPGTPVKVIAAALADALASKVLREDIARALLVEAQSDAGSGELVAVRDRAGELMGMTRQGVERRFALAGKVPQGRFGLTAAELSEMVTALRG